MDQLVSIMTLCDLMLLIDHYYLFFEENIEDFDHGTATTKQTGEIVQKLIKEIEDAGMKVIEYSYDPETGDFSYVVEIESSDTRGSSGIKTSDISDIVDKTLEEEGIDDYVQGEQETKVTDPIVQELLKELEKNGIEVSEYDYDPETGDFSYVVLVTQDLKGSGSKSTSSPVDELFDVIEESLKDQGVEDYDQGTPKVNTTTPVVEQLIEDIEKDGKVKVTEYTYDAETGEFFYIVEIVVESIWTQGLSTSRFTLLGTWSSSQNRNDFFWSGDLAIWR